MWNFKLYSNFRKEQNQTATKWFSTKQYHVQQKYPFILKSSNDWRKNIILQSVANFIENKKNSYEEIGEPFPIHKYIHHGLSSQAMLFNLLVDPVEKKDLKFFSNLFKYEDLLINNDSEFFFEYSDRTIFNEKQQQPTSFDFAIKNKKGKNIFIEAKYVETEFGQCSTIKNGDCEGLNPIKDPELCYLVSKGRNYWDLMKKYQLDLPFRDSPICPFAVYYQFYRELIFAVENNGYYVLLIDSRNPAFSKSTDNIKRGLIPVLMELIPVGLQPNIKIIHIQEVVEKLEKFGYNWTKEFREKYGIRIQ